MQKVNSPSELLVMRGWEQEVFEMSLLHLFSFCIFTLDFLLIC